MSEPHDDLDDILAPKPVPESAGLRDALFRQTAHRLARRVVVRRVAKITAALTAVAAVFVVGAAAGWVTKIPDPGRPDPLGPLSPNVAPVVVTVVVPVPVPVPLPDPSARIAVTPDPPTAAAAELRAEQADDPQEAARLYRLAGDRYLNDLDDYANAARCYRLYLARAGDAGLTPEPGDTWLLTSLKNAAFKEKRNASKSDG
jgi:hypothetical protein